LKIDTEDAATVILASKRITTIIISVSSNRSAATCRLRPPMCRFAEPGNRFRIPVAGQCLEMTAGAHDDAETAGRHFGERCGGLGDEGRVVQLMRALWNGEKVTIDGEVVKFKDGALDWKPTAKPELYIASRGPKILSLGGRVADGVLIGSFATPAGIQYAKQHIQTGLEAAKRTWKDIQLCSWIYVSILDREDDPVPEAIKRGVSFAFWSSRDVLGKMADQLASDVSDEFRAFMRDAPHAWTPEVMAELRRLMPRGVIDSLAVVGTASQVVQRLRALEDAGIQEAIIWPFPKEGQDTETMLAKVASDVISHMSAPH
jgi:alkanesulfonate monooxygenase SsuD/methylene tetrahydromethanopterin reductase-like flavin-dependent oxidoreductase (luciferase family)